MGGWSDDGDSLMPLAVMVTTAVIGFLGLAFAVGFMFGRMM